MAWYTRQVAMPIHVRPSGFHPGPDYLALPRDPQQWVIRDLIPVNGLVNLYGEAKSRKTRLALGMADAISNNKPDWMGFQVCKFGPVCIFQIDTPRGEMAGRIKALMDTGHNTERIFVSDRLTTPFPFNILEPSHQQWLTENIAKVEPVVVFVDTLRESFTGDENSSDLMKQVVNKLYAACGSAALVLISHARKDSLFAEGGSDNLFGDARGSGYVAGRMDTVIKMTGAFMCYQSRSEGRTNIPVVPYVKGEEDPSGLLEIGSGAGLTPEASERMTAALIAIMEAEPQLSRNKIETRVANQFKVGKSTVKKRLDLISSSRWFKPYE